jgi:ABC-type branched-subunit amino acid transport system substrate-binding protein
MSKRKKKRKKEENKKRKGKNRVIIISPGSLDAKGFSKDFKIKTHTHFSNHVQSDNEDFVGASGSFFAICTCPPI